jgi:hypothetical protein
VILLNADHRRLVVQVGSAEVLRVMAVDVAIELNLAK